MVAIGAGCNASVVLTDSPSGSNGAVRASLSLSDGVKLRALYHLPSEAKDRKVGTSLVFSPYKIAESLPDWAKARSDKGGYARVQVDCRGTGGSEGRFEAYRPGTVDDAKDVLDAIAAQSWSDGRVVMSGGSFPGWTQFCAMRSGHPALVACSPSVMILDPYHLYFSNGCRVDKFQPGWHRKFAGTNDYDEVVSHTKRNDPFWERLADVRRLDESRAGVFYQGGWFDMIGLKTMETYNRLRRNGRRVFLRMGPWAHGVNTYADGGIDFKALGGSVTEDLELDFLEKALRGEKPQTDDLPGQILLYVMGRNEWRYETEWPLKGTKPTVWPLGKGKTTFCHDPANPVPTCGGRLTPGGGLREQSAVEARADVLKFTGEELKEDLEVTGDVKAHIVFSSTSVTNDIAVKLVDVWPDGKAYGVVDSICRADDCVPGEAKAIDFPVDSTAYVFLKGHRIRIDVAGSSKPHYEVNPTAAEVTVDAAASNLVLPVIPAAGLSARGEVVVDDKVPAGNAIVEGVEGSTVRLRQDMRDSNDWFYWAFRVTGAEGRTLKFVFTDPYAGGPVSCRGPAVTKDGGNTWSYPCDGKAKENEFTYAFAADEKEVWFYQTFQYYPWQWDEFLKKHGSDRGKVFETGVLCKSRKGRDVPKAVFGRIDGKARYRVWLSSRTHCGEAPATYVLEGWLERVFGKDALGAWLRENVEFMVVPFVDYDGVVDGDQGKGRKPHDHNRDYTEFLYPESRAIAAWIAERAKCRIDVVFDHHSPWVRNVYNEKIYQTYHADEWNTAAKRKWGGFVMRHQDGSLDYSTADDFPWGFGWNTPKNTANPKPGGKPLKGLGGWIGDNVTNLLINSTYEIPFANAKGNVVTPEKCRAFGNASAVALRDFLEAMRPMTQM